MKANLWIRLGAFLALALGIPWLITSAYPTRNPALGKALALLFAYTPALAAVLVQRFLCSGPTLRSLGLVFRTARWFALAWLVPFVLSCATLCVGLLFPGARFSDLEERGEWMILPDVPRSAEIIADWQRDGILRVAEGGERDRLLPSRPDPQAGWTAFPVIRTHQVAIAEEFASSLLSGPTSEALQVFGEEVGWRGFLLGELLPLGFWRASLLVGLIWGVWHAPWYLAGHGGLTGTFLDDLARLVAFTVLLSPLFSWIRIRSRSVLPAVVLHGCVNASLWISALIQPKGTYLFGMSGLAGALVFLAAWGLLARFDRSIRHARGLPTGEAQAPDGSP